MVVRKPKLHMICGFVGAGKTTLAKQLEKQYRAIRFSTDEWMIELFGFNGNFEKEYSETKKRCKDFIWRLSKSILASGQDVILDFGFWAKKERMLFRKRAKQAGIISILYFVDTPLDVIQRRISLRNKNLPPKTFHITDKWLNKWLPSFQPPSMREKPIISSKKGFY